MYITVCSIVEELQYFQVLQFPVDYYVQGMWVWNAIWMHFAPYVRIRWAVLFMFRRSLLCRRACGTLIREAPRLLISPHRSTGIYSRGHPFGRFPNHGEGRSQITVVQRLLYTTPHNITRSDGRRQGSECCAVIIFSSRILSRP